MEIDIKLPALPGGTARVLRWLRAPGEVLAAGEPLLIVLTDLVEAVLPAPGAGELAELLVAEDGEAAPGAALARLKTVRAAPPPRATPLARRVAAAAGIDVARLGGSGVDGRVLRRDVLAFLAAHVHPGTIAEAPSAREEARGGASSPAEAVLMPGGLPSDGAGGSLRLTVAARWPSVPAALTVMEVDMGAVASYQAACRTHYQRRGLLLDDLLCVAWAVAAVLPEHPLLNGRWEGDGILLRRRVHLAIGRAAGRAPQVVYDAGDLTIRGLSRALQGPATAPADESLGQQLVATFTLVAASGLAIPAIGPGQSAALSVGPAAPRLLVANDQLVIRPVVWLALAYDARVLCQHHADAFLTALRQRLQTLPAGC